MTELVGMVSESCSHPAGSLEEMTTFRHVGSPARRAVAPRLTMRSSPLAAPPARARPTASARFPESFVPLSAPRSRPGMVNVRSGWIRFM